MRHRVHDLNEGRQTKALRTIETWVERLTGEAVAPIEKAWFLPKWAENIDGALAEVEGHFGIPAENLTDLVRSSEFRKHMEAWMPVRRTQGWLGYLWWDLYQDMQTSMSVRFCQHCGNVIRGGRVDRRYCTREENAVCARQRNGTAQKKTRARERSRTRRNAASKPEWL